MRRSIDDTLFSDLRSTFLVVLVIGGLSLAGCSSSKPTPDEEYFDPMKMTMPDPDRASATTYFKPRIPESPRYDTLQKAVQVQNERIAKLEQDLAVIATRQGVEAVERESAERDRPGEALLLALIREQNLRLDEIIEQVRLMGEKKAAVAEVVPNIAATIVRKALPRANDGRAYALYVQGIAEYKRMRYREAIAKFDAALAQGIRSSLSDNCRFWTGVSHYQLREFRRSLTQFEQVARDRSSDKRSSALLMTGQSLDQLGRRDLAQMAYTRIIQEYPRSNLRSVAEKKIWTSKGGGPKNL